MVSRPPRVKTSTYKKVVGNGQLNRRKSVRCLPVMLDNAYWWNMNASDLQLGRAAMLVVL